MSQKAMSQKRRTTHRLIGHLAVAMLAFGGVLAPTLPAQAGSARHLGPVPDTAFLQPEDTGGHSGWRPDDVGKELHPLLPCGAARYASRQARSAAGTMAYDYPVDDFHTVLVEHLTRFRGDWAARYLTELRRAVTRQGCTDRTGRWTLLASGVAGRDSLLIELRRQIIDYSGKPITHRTYLVVARTGRIVIVLADVGWETGSGHLSTVRGLAPAAVRRAGASVGLPGRYRGTPLDLPGESRTWARDMNDRGQIVGQREIRTDVVHPFLWHRGTAIDLGVLETGPDEMGIAAGINAHGDVVGGSRIGSTNHAVLWRRGRIIDLGTLGGAYSFANAINDRGQIVGNSEVASGELHGFIWQNGRMRDLGIRGFTMAVDINNRGQVVGSSTFGAEGRPYRAYLWQGGRVTRLPAATFGSQANAVNGRGEVVGSMVNDDDGARSFHWYRGRLTYLGTLAGGQGGAAFAINDRGWILGSGSVEPHSMLEHPFLGWRGLLWDLTRMGIPEEEGYWLAAVNNRGQILGRNTVYTPVPASSW